MLRSFAVLLSVSLLFVSGCGGPDRLPLIPVSGTVTMDGKPLEKISVTFHPETGRSASGVTDAEGKFRLTTYDTNDGAVIGKHKVSLSQMLDDIPDEIPEDYDYVQDGEVANVSIPEKYLDPETSGLISTIVGDESLKEVTIVVEK